MGTLSSITSLVSPLVNNLTSDRANHNSSTNGVTTLRDYEHARKVFGGNNNQLSPKPKNWFHVYFELDPTALEAVNAALGSGNTDNQRIFWNPSRLPGLGVLVKSVSLPNFNFDVKKGNQYNRWSIGSTKINYKPVTLNFWDDTLDMVRGFWFAYYQYMIQDPSYVNWTASQTEGVAVPNQFSPSLGYNSSLYTSSENWAGYYGLDTKSSSITPTDFSRTAPFFRSIRIFQFNRNNHPDKNKGASYSEYVLVNPIISDFDHDTADFSTSEFMSNKMTVEFETVLYNSGFIGNDEIASWDYITGGQKNNSSSSAASGGGGATPGYLFDTSQTILPGQINSTKVTTTSQLLSVASKVLPVAQQINQLATNTGQASVGTVLTAAVGAAAQVNQQFSKQTNQLVNSPSGTNILVPTVVPGYGTGGAPPGQ